MLVAGRSNASLSIDLLLRARFSFLPRLQLGAVAFQSLLVQIENTPIARAFATIVLARPDRSNRWRIVVGGKRRHGREQRDAIVVDQANKGYGGRVISCANRERTAARPLGFVAESIGSFGPSQKPAFDQHP
jgi:hypothetical protein